MIKISSSWPSTCSEAQCLHHFGFPWGWGLPVWIFTIHGPFLQCIGVPPRECMSSSWRDKKFKSLWNFFCSNYDHLENQILEMHACRTNDTVIKLKLVGTLNKFLVNHATLLLSYHTELNWENLCCWARISVFAMLRISCLTKPKSWQIIHQAMINLNLGAILKMFSANIETLI